MNASKVFTDKKGILEAVLLAALLGLNAFVLSQITFRLFALADFGSFLDVAWRMSRGQKLYLDVYFHTGPVHVGILALFFRIFGFTKTAILLQPLMVSSLCLTAVFLTTRDKITLPFRVLTALLTAGGLFWGYPHPWYDMTAHMFGILPMAFMMRRLPFGNRREALTAGLLAGAGAVLALLTKTNIGFAYLGIFGLVLLWGPGRIAALTGYALGILAAVSVSLLTFLPHPVAYFENAYLSYALARSSQAYRLLFILAWLKNLYWLPLAAVWLARKIMRRPLTPLFVLFTMTAVLAIFDLNTGSLRDMDHLPVFGIYLAMGFLLLEELKGPGEKLLGRGLRMAALATLTVTGLVQLKTTVESARMHYDLTHPTYPHGSYPLKTGGFKGWLFYESYGRTIDEIAAFIQEKIPPEESLLILTDLYVLNGLTGRDSYRGIASIWPFFIPIETGGAPKEKIRDNILEHPPDWLLVKKGSGLEDVAVLLKAFEFPESFLKGYALVKTWGPYGILRRVS